MPNFRSLIGGPFGDGKTGPVAFRANNPGAINGAAWERAIDGYVGDFKYDGKNNTTVFEAPEQGIHAWMKLLQLYRRAGAVTMRDIVIRYGGGQSNYEREYLPTLIRWTGLPDTTEVKIDGSDDVTLLIFAKAMFRYESGLHPLPWTELQIIFGINLFRKAEGMINTGAKPVEVPAAKPTAKAFSWWDLLFKPTFWRK